MKRTAFLIGVSVMVFCSVGSDVVLANANGNNRNNAQRNDEKRENEAVDKARKDVNNAERVVKDAERALKQVSDKLRSAEVEHSRAASTIQRVRDELETRHGDLTGFTEAKRKLDEARRTYEKAGEPILKRLAETDKYKSALEAAEKADRQIASLRQGDVESAERIKQLAELAKTKLIPAQLERESLDADSSLENERKALREAEKAVAKSKDEVDRAVEKDPKLKDAKDAFEKAKDHVASVRKTVAQEAKQLADARQKLARENRDLQQKIAADQKDDNRGKNKGKK